jgi:epoxyqueuosine reductase
VTSADVKQRAAELGFDLCGIARADVFPELSFLHEWIARGFAGEMHYLACNAERRTDARAVLPSALSVIALGTVYNTERPYSTANADARVAAISRYAWGDDYHDVIRHRMDLLLEWIRQHAGTDVDARAYVDTGPVQERFYARQAGLGWIGKHTCVINEERGSWIFLSEILCSLPLEPDAPALDQCGTCTLCIDACPTGAIVEPYVLDSRRCLSYLTIELKGSIPAVHRDDVGGHAYGCDICQEVCPWNLTPQTAVSADEPWQPRAGLDRPTLVELWTRSDDQLRGLLKGSAMKRAGVSRLRRNLAVAIGNSGDPEAAEVLERPADGSSADPLVAEHVAWAVEKLRAEETKRSSLP